MKFKQKNIHTLTQVFAALHSLCFMRFKAEVRYYLEKIGSKFISLKDIMHVYGNYYNVFKAYLFNGSGNIILRDSYGNKFPIPIGKGNVDKVIWLAKILSTCGEFRVEEGEIRLPCGSHFDVNTLLRSDLDMIRLNLMCVLMNLGARFNLVDDRYALVEVDTLRFLLGGIIHGILWKVPFFLGFMSLMNIVSGF